MNKWLSLLLLLPAVGWATKIERVIKATDPKVVKIGIVSERGTGVCSGAIISPEGDILTCAHCFEDRMSSKIFVKDSDRVVYNAYIIKIDTTTDLAVLGLIGREGYMPWVLFGQAPNNFPYFAAGDEPKKGQQVLSFGAPLGLQGTDTVGWVDNIINKDGIFVVHSAFISPGNSGGPLVDLHGRLIGINEATFIYGFFQIAHGMYIAIDIHTVKEFLGGN
jgi:putative serine protease PepD